MLFGEILTYLNHYTSTNACFISILRQLRPYFNCVKGVCKLHI